MRPSAQELPVQMPKRAHTCGLWTICSLCRFSRFNKSAALFWNLSHSNIVFMIALMYHLDGLLGVLTPERSGTAVLEATGDAIKQTKYSFQVHFETLRGGFWGTKCWLWHVTCGLFPAFYQQSVVLSLFFFSNLSLTFKKYFYVENPFLQRRQNNFFQDHEKMLARVFLVEIKTSAICCVAVWSVLCFTCTHTWHGVPTHPPPRCSEMALKRCGSTENNMSEGCCGSL